MLKYCNAHDSLSQDTRENLSWTQIFSLSFIILSSLKPFQRNSWMEIGKWQQFQQNIYIFFCWKILAKCFVSWRAFLENRSLVWLCIWCSWRNRNQWAGRGLRSCTCRQGSLAQLQGLGIECTPCYHLIAPLAVFLTYLKAAVIHSTDVCIIITCHPLRSKKCKSSFKVTKKKKKKVIFAEMWKRLLSTHKIVNWDVPFK